MAAFPIIPPPTGGRLSAPSWQYFRSSSGSPIRQHHFQHHGDDLISGLSPSTAVHAIRFPTGALKECLDAASANEQSFAMQAAMAATSVQQWLDELSLWPWPSGGGSAGFEKPSSNRRRLKAMTGRAKPRPSSSTSPLPSTPSDPSAPSTPSTPPSPSPEPIRADPITLQAMARRISDPFSRADDDRAEHDGDCDNVPYLGSLPAVDVARYAFRIAEIQREFDELEVEDIKQHVLHHHIMPLTPPGTPSMDGSLRRPSSTTSATNLVKMDDLSAVVTAIVLQFLPLLSRLVRLLDVWHIRLSVLKKTPVFFDALDAAETAIRSAQHAIRLGEGSAHSRQAGQELRQDEVYVMKSAVEKRVSRAAQIADYMLDTLDGWEDTIPNDWVDRVDAVEREYAKWVATCERKLRDLKWKRKLVNKPKLSPPVHVATAAVAAATAVPTVVAVPAVAAVPTVSTVPSTPRTSGFTQTPLEPTAEANAGTATLPKSTDLTKAAVKNVGFQTPPSLSPRSSFGSLRLEPSLPIIRKTSPGGLSDESSPAPVSALDDSPPRLREKASHLSISVGTPESVVHHVDMGDIGDISMDGDMGEISEMGDIGDALSSDKGSSPSHDQSPDRSPSSSPPDFRASTRSTVTFNDMPTVNEIPAEEGPYEPHTPLESSFFANEEDEDIDMSQQDLGSPGSQQASSLRNDDDQLQQQIYEILENIPAKIHLSSQPALNHLNPPDFKMPRKPRATPDIGVRSTSSMSNMSTMSSRSGTPSFLLAPAYARNSRSRLQRGNQEIKLYHLSRSTGEAPIKLFIRLVGEGGERVMVRVGGGWADLSEYLKEYASHHSRRSKNGGESKIEIRDVPTTSSSNNRVGSSPPSRPGSVLDTRTATPPLVVRKTRRSVGEEGNKNPRTPLTSMTKSSNTPSSESSTRSRSSSRLSWTEDDSSLGMSGPRARNIEMSEESKAWVESVKERVRIASGERRVSDQLEGRFGEIGKAGGTKRVFRKG